MIDNFQEYHVSKRAAAERRTVMAENKNEYNADFNSGEVDAEAFYEIEQEFDNAKPVEETVHPLVVARDGICNNSSRHTIETINAVKTQLCVTVCARKFSDADTKYP